MKLLGSVTSPYVRKVRIVMLEKRVECTFAVDAPWSASSIVPHHNPLGKIPVLIIDNGNSIFDSRVIVEYLDNLTPLNRLIPEPNRQRIDVKRWEALADGLCDALVSIHLEKARPPQQQSPEWISRQEKKVAAALSAISQDLADKNWCSGELYNLSDIAVGCALGYLDLRFADIDWRNQYPNLAKHAEKLALRPSFKETEPAPTSRKETA
jgi:glutathione S-transferase